MNIIILRLTDQPAVNIVENIVLHGRYDYQVKHREFMDFKDTDLVFYYNINDVFQSKIYDMLKRTQHSFCAGVQSWRLLLEKDWIDRLKELNVIGLCAPTLAILNVVKSEIDLKAYKVTPFSADERYFGLKSPIKCEGKLRVGYVGSFREDKKFLTVVKPAFDMLKDKIEPIIYGRAGGKRLGHQDMSFGYNNMDCLVVGSSHESGPMPPLEAALCGRPTITTRCGMMEDIFDNESACFVDGNYKSMAAAIELFINNRLLCKEKGTNARRRVLNFWNWKNLIEHQDDFFEACYELR